MKEKTNIAEPLVTYATIEQLNDEARTRANNDALINNSLNALSNDYQAYKSTTNTQLNNKQNRTDNTLNTNSKLVVGAINELKTTSDDYQSQINQNTDDIAYIQENYAQATDIDAKQDKNDDSLTTSDHSVVGAINELKTTSDINTTNINANATAISANTNSIEDIKTINQTQETQINENTANINANTAAISQNSNDIASIKADYVKGSDIANQLDTKQNISDNSLNTSSKTVPGAINELKTTNDTNTANISANTSAINENTSKISQNSNDITDIKTNYVKASDIGNQLDEKQDKNDENLTTNNHTVTGAINEIKLNNDTNTTKIAQNTNDIEDIKTINQTQETQINENIANINANTAAISQNSNDIATIKADYVKSSEIGNQLDEKQDKNDDNLTTNDHTVVGAINELKTTSDINTTNINANATAISANTNSIEDIKTINQTQETQINENTANINANTATISQNSNDIASIKADYVKGSEIGNQLDEKQDKNDDNLTTNDHNVVGAINELKTTNDSNTANISANTTAINENTNQIAQNINDIEDIKTNYAKNSDIGNQLDAKQNITDESLNTTDNTIPGAINELYNNKVSNDDFGSFTESVIQYQNITNNALNNKQDKVDGDLLTSDISVVGAINELKSITDNNTTKITANTTAISTIKSTYMTTATATSLLAAKQNSTDNALTTTSKNIVGAINELKTNSQTWTAVGTSATARTWNYNLIINRRYRIAYNWSANDATSKIYKEFVWTGNTISLETYTDKFSGVTLLGITVLGSADIVELAANSAGITINTKMGSSTLGRIIGLEQAS